MESSSNDKLQDLLLLWFKKQKDAQNNNQSDTSPEVDVAHITWLLKTIGFKLDFMDFVESQSTCSSKNISIEVKCGSSGLTARLNYTGGTCVCPSKKIDSSFWEVQSASPAEQGVKRETSCSLLPPVSENCAIVSKAILSNLLNYYKESVQESTNTSPPSSNTQRKIKVFDDPHFEDVRRDMLKRYNNFIENSSCLYNKEKLQSVDENSVESNSHDRLSRKGTFPIKSTDSILNTINKNDSPDYAGFEAFKEQQSKRISTIQTPDAGEFSSPDPMECNNSDNPHIKVTRTGTFPINELESSRIAALSSMGLDSSIASLESIGNLGTNFSPFDASPKRHDTERDENVIEALNQARKHIDQALLFMKFNITQHLSPPTGQQLVNTPLSRIDPPTPLQRSRTATSITEHEKSVKKVQQINRRSSFGIKRSSPLIAPTITRSRVSMGGNASLTRLASSSGGSLNASAGAGDGSRLTVTKKSAKLAANSPSLIERFKLQQQQAAKKPGNDKKTVTKK